MYLKSLTLRGFKSFASATTLNFEPGITAVVGPNGSGKSNVVDAIAWVLGEQGAKSLRGGKMEDVIFAGTAGRPPLGRAEVTLTIDNADGALPIDYAEVAITRRMFRDGASEYEINGSSCRLLDVQELLSDSGIGREMHVIVGQGQLDAVLSARPEDRRAFVEEAAGVLKHRKRKEKALRKLDAMQANLTRLTDLTGELRRQLKPLGRQAEVARRAMTIQAELREARLRLLADDLVSLRRQAEADAADEQAAQDLRDRVQRELAAATAAHEAALASLADAAPATQAAQDTWYALSALAERIRGTLNLAEERARHLHTPVADSAGTGRDPERLDAQADAAAADHEAKQQLVTTATEALDATIAERVAQEAVLAAADAALSAQTRAIADRREGLAKLTGSVNAARSRLSAIDDELARLSASLVAAESRGAAATSRYSELEASAGLLGSTEVDLDERYETAQDAAHRSAAQLTELAEQRRSAAAEQSTLQARVDALRLGLARRDAVGAVLDAPDLPVLGAVSSLVEIAPGAQAAVAAALGAAADAVAVASLDDAAATLAWLRDSDAGRAGVVVGGGPDTVDPDWPALPGGARWAIDLVTVPSGLRAAFSALLDRVAVVDDLDAAAALVHGLPDVRAVTDDGDVVGAGWAVGGSSGTRSLLEIQVAVDEAAAGLERVTADIERLDAQLAETGERAAADAAAADTALRALHASDAELNAVAEELGRLAEASRSAAAEADRLRAQHDAVEQSRAERQRIFDELAARLEAAESTDVGDVVDPAPRNAAAHAVGRARQLEMDARLALRTAEERAWAVADSAVALRRAAKAEREARARAERAREFRQQAAAVAARVADRARLVAGKLTSTLVVAGERRDHAVARRAEAERAVGEQRELVAALTAQWERLTSEVHRDELLRAQQAVRIEQLVDKAVVEHSIAVEDLLAEFGPEVPTPPSAVELAEYEAAKERGEQVYAPQPMPFDRAGTERRLRAAERDLVVLGKVNPLALEEFAALEERHAFLSTQLGDLKDTRRDLLVVVDEVDAKIRDVFASAFADVAREFTTVFATLFPGGEGELVLTDPSDMLATGIEVNARPPGKRIKRLSLLSGGERSLTAVAMLVAIFRARPSPFYVMDEVEAALDEVNLTRLVGLMEQLRESSQLIVITHQKFTMESADALYGVSMRGDGITQVISQRIRGLVGAPG